MHGIPSSLTSDFIYNPSIVPGIFLCGEEHEKLVLLTLIVSLCSFALAADDQAKESKATDRVQAAADVLNESKSAPDTGIPQEILGKAECVAVVPSMLKGGFIVGAKYGRGLASCRTPEGLERARILSRRRAAALAFRSAGRRWTWSC